MSGQHGPDNLILISDQQGGIRQITLNRPEKLNAFLEPMREQLAESLESLAADDDVRVCVITGAGRGFCAGGDVKIMRGLIETGSHTEVHRFLDFGARVVRAIRRAPVPVIAAVNGPAAGAGMNLALACDYRIASDRAAFGETFVNIGLHSDWGGSYFLPRLVGTSRALELLWTGRMIEAEEALQLGIVDRIVPDTSLMAFVTEFATGLARKPRQVLALLKNSVYQSVQQDIDHNLKLEYEAQAACLRAASSSELMQAFLARKNA
jgi:2-(1,2-epoxy-1,2-dihydrophenyl)acetyl-CoA isomerase